MTCPSVPPTMRQASRSPDRQGIQPPGPANQVLSCVQPVCALGNNALDRHVLWCGRCYLSACARRAVEHTLCYCAVLFSTDWPPLAWLKGRHPWPADGDASHLHDTGHAIATRIIRRRCSHASAGYILNEVHAHVVVGKRIQKASTVRPVQNGSLGMPINNSSCSFTPSLLCCYHIKPGTTVPLAHSNNQSTRFILPSP